MKRKNFKEALKIIKLFRDQEIAYNNFGIDLYEGSFPIGDTFGKLTDLFFETHYKNDGIDWINWWMWENDFGENELEAYDEHLLICQTEDGLYDFIKKYSK